MRAVLLAGGLGTRITEETGARPKPMIEIGGKPILWHIMKIYSAHGINDFIVCLGYKGYIIKEYFANYFTHTSDITIDLQKNEIKVHNSQTEPWRITLVDTGETTMTGGRLRRIAEHLPADELFCMTYGDGVADIDIGALVAHAQRSGKLATLTTVQPPGRYGALRLEQSDVKSFCEKPVGDGGWVNGGFFVLHPKVLDYIQDDSTAWERAPLENLAADGQLSAFHHHGFWLPLDTLRDKMVLEGLWAQGKAPWRVW